MKTSNEINKIINNDNDEYLVIPEFFSSLEQKNGIDTVELIFMSQKEKIKKILSKQNEENEKIKIKLGNNIPAARNETLYTLLDKNIWEYTSFHSEYLDLGDPPNFGFPWETSDHITENFCCSKGLEIRNLSLRTIKEYDLNNCGIEINTNFSLKGEAAIWIFSRSSINLNFNVSDSVKEFDVLNKYSTIVKVSKEDKSQKCFISLHVLTENENGDYYFRNFLKQQLINLSSRNLILIL